MKVTVNYNVVFSAAGKYFLIEEVSKHPAEKVKRKRIIYHKIKKGETADRIASQLEANKKYAFLNTYCNIHNDTEVTQ